MSKPPSSAIGGIYISILCWIIAATIYFTFDPTTVIWCTPRTSLPMEAQTVMGLFFIVGIVGFVIAFTKWWFDKPNV